MANPYYDHTTYPATGAAGSSAALRAELDSIEAGFDKLPTLSGNGGAGVLVNAAGTAMTASSVLFENAGKIGIGTSVPAYLLDVKGTSAILARISTNDGTSANNAGALFQMTASSTASTRRASLFLDSSGADGAGLDYLYVSINGSLEAEINNTGAGPLSLATNNTARVRITSTGLVGIAKTPDAGYVLDVSGTIRSIGGEVSSSGYGVRVVNAANNGGGSITAPTGASGGLRLSSDGGPLVLQILQAAEPALATNKDMVFTLISDTSLRISVRGSDGVTRHVDLTLAT